MKHTFKICATVLLVLMLALSVSLMVGCDDKTSDPQVNATAADRGDTIASGKAVDGTTWTVYESGALAITGTPASGVMADYSNTVPAWKAYANEVTGLTLDNSIKTISTDAFSSMKNLIWVQFGTGTEHIGQNAFRSCSNLRRLVIPDGTKTIGKNAFDGCYRLYEANIPNSVTQIGDNAFTGCSSLLTVRFPDSAVTVGKNVFTDSYKLIEVITSNTSVSAGAANNGGVALNATTKGVHSADTASILTNDNGFLLDGNRLMGYVGNETAVVVPANVVMIADYAFYSNTAIKSVDVGNKVGTIGVNAFGGCTGIETLTIGTNVTIINPGAFSNCSGIKTVNFNSTKFSNTCKTEGLFENCTALTTISFGKGAKLPVGEGMFRGCTALKSVTLPAVASIPAGMFENCTGLESVTFNSTNKTIGDYAFRNCTALVELDLTQLAASSTISTYAFEGCASIVTIDLAKVSKVEEGAFNYCKALTSVVTGTTFPTSNKQAFDGCVKLIDVVNNTLNSKGESNNIQPGGTNNMGVAKYTTFATGKGESRLKYTAEGYIFFETADANYLVGYAGDATDLVLPANYGGKAYEVYNNAFSNNKKITSVKIGAGVSAIGTDAFRGCTRLVRADFTGATFAEIPAFAFEGCSALETLVLVNSITTIGESAFANTTALGEVDLLNVSTLAKRAFRYSGVTKVTAGAGLVTIENDTFSGCERLVQVTFPGATTVGIQAFANCVSLRALSIPVVETIGEYAFYRNTALAYVNLPAGKTIAQGAFQACGGLMSLSLGENMTTIEESAFRDCGKLLYIINKSEMNLSLGEMGPGYVTRNAEVIVNTESDLLKTAGDYTYMLLENKTYLLAYTGTETDTITLPAPSELGGATAYDVYRFAFFGTEIKNVIVPEGVGVIGVSAFAYSSIESISLPASLRELHDSVFEGSTLREITLKEGITKIGNACFKNCSELREFKMPNTLKTMGISVFRECVSLRRVTIGTGLERIPDFAFDGCVSIGQLVVPNNIPFGQRWCWGCSKLLEVWTPKGSALGMSITLNDRTQVINVNTSSNAAMERTKTDENGYVFYSYMSKNFLIDYIGTDTNLVLPAKAPDGGTYQIFDYAFYNCDFIETVRFSERINGVGRYAFAECDNLKGIFLPVTLSGDFGVGENLFWGCSNTLVVATGFASEEALPDSWRTTTWVETGDVGEDGKPVLEAVYTYGFNVQGPASAYNVVYGVTYDLFVTMLK